MARGGVANQGEATGSYMPRYKWLVLVMLLAMGGIVARLWYLQILQGELYYKASTQNIIRDVNLSPSRGRIYDRHGIVLADNRPSFDVYITPRVLREQPAQARAEVLALLKRHLNLTNQEMTRLQKRLEQRVAEVVVRRDVTRQQVSLLEAHRLSLPSVEVRPNAHRVYPLHALGAHTVGFMGEVGTSELQAMSDFGYHVGDYVGRMGLEQAFEPILRGSPGLRREVIDSAGTLQGESATELLLGEYQQVHTVPGRDVVTTLDAELLLIIDRAMRKHPAGAVVALDPRDGSVLALYSKPGFDPNSWSGRLSSQEKLRADNDPYRPMLDKTVNAYFPGSVYKIVGSLAALETGNKQVEDEVMCPGYYKFGGRRFRCWKYAGHGHTNVIGALASSCDVYYYKVAEELGIDKLAEYAYRFGFGEPTGLPINHESAGRVPTKEWHRKHGPDGYQHGFALNTVIGQGDTLASPLQVALAYAAVANGGDLYYPKLLREVRTREGEVMFTFPSHKRKRIEFDPVHLATIRRGLWEVINEKHGSAFATRLPDLEIAGKTGTAQVHKIGRVRVANRDKALKFRDHAWFAAYAPAAAPELVLVTFLEHGGSGSSAAAPVAVEIFDQYFKRDAAKPLTARISAQAAQLARERAQQPEPEPELLMEPVPEPGDGGEALDGHDQPTEPAHAP